MRTLAAVVLATLSSTALSQNLIVNGSFESPSVGVGSYLAFVANSNLGGWLVSGTGTAVMLLNTTYAETNLTFASQSGQAAIDLTGAGNTGFANSVSQIVATVPGTAYKLDFFVGNADGSGNAVYGQPSLISLIINGVPIQTFSNSSVTTRSINWMPFSVEFTATGVTTTVAFANATPSGDNFAGLDNVVLSAVNDAHPMLLALAGLPIVGWARTRRRAVSGALRQQKAQSQG